MVEVSDIAKAVIVAAAMFSASVQAQEASSCTIPARLPTPRAELPDRPSDVRRMAIGGYTLALSWSPGFCASQRGRSDTQCDGSAGRFGFILHGLWPEGKNGAGWPQYCAPATILPRAVVAAQFCTTPSVQLMQHEWAKHGTCMARRPEEYFAKGRALMQQLRLPDMRTLARQRNVTAGTLIREITSRNPVVRPEAIRVRTSRGAWLSEVWICLDIAFRPARCPVSKKGAAFSTPLRVQLPR